MLPPAQVIPFLLHDDADVREHACHYLAEANDPAPATADDFWRVIDRFGMQESLPFVARLDTLPQTDASFARLTQALRDGVGDKNTKFHLQRAFAAIDFELLIRRRDEVLAFDEVPPDIRDHHAQRLALAEVPFDELWERLSRHAQDVHDAYAGRFDHRISERLIEALARHPDAAAARAMERLRDGPGDDWMEIFCVQLLGRLRHHPAIEPLVARLLIDTDLLRERVCDALVEIGDAEVVRQIEAMYPGQAWHVRLYADGPIARIKRPESEAALLRLMKVETEADLLTGMAAGLCDLCTTEGLEAVRELVVDDRWDGSMAELDEMLLTVGTMVGYDPPEGWEWRRRVAERRREREARMRAFDRLLGTATGARRFEEAFAETVNGMNAKADAPPAAAHPGAGAADAYAPEPSALAPIHRAAPKVGRNDPCPCGSGKKYKKCCLSKDAAAR